MYNLFVEIVCSAILLLICIELWHKIGPHIKDVVKFNDIRALTGHRASKQEQDGMDRQDQQY